MAGRGCSGWGNSLQGEHESESARLDQSHGKCGRDGTSHSQALGEQDGQLPTSGVFFQPILRDGTGHFLAQGENVVDLPLGESSVDRALQLTPGGPK